MTRPQRDPETGGWRRNHDPADSILDPDADDPTPTPVTNKDDPSWVQPWAGWDS